MNPNEHSERLHSISADTHEAKENHLNDLDTEHANQHKGPSESASTISRLSSLFDPSVLKKSVTDNVLVHKLGESIMSVNKTIHEHLHTDPAHNNQAHSDITDSGEPKTSDASSINVPSQGGALVKTAPDDHLQSHPVQNNQTRSDDAKSVGKNTSTSSEINTSHMNNPEAPTRSSVKGEQSKIQQAINKASILPSLVDASALRKSVTANVQKFKESVKTAEGKWKAMMTGAVTVTALFAVVALCIAAVALFSGEETTGNETTEELSVINPAPYFPKTCDDINEVGLFRISPDIWKVQPFYIFCNFTYESGFQQTIISHDSMGEIQVDDCNPSKCYKRKINYGFSMSQMRVLLGYYENCTQYIKYRCVGSLLSLGGNAAWLSIDGSRSELAWGGPNITFPCVCGVSGSCVDPKEKCNCDINNVTMPTSDEGYLTDMKKLPVTELQFGDAEASGGEFGWHTLGPLICTRRNGSQV